MMILPTNAKLGITGIRADEEAILNDLLSPRLNARIRKKTISDLFAKFSTLRRIVHAPCRSVKAVTNGGAIAYEEIQKARKLAVELARVEIGEKPVLSQYGALIKYCRTLLAGERRELFYVLLLNKSNQLMASHCLQSGTIDHVSVYPRELFNLAMEYSAAALILVHNHPGGCPKPSKGDIQMTEILSKIGHYMGVKLKDHIIVASTGTYSFSSDNKL